MTTRTVRLGPGYRAHVDVEPGALVVRYESQHCWFPTLWEPRETVTLRSEPDMRAHTRHRGLRLVLLASWVEAVALRAAMIRRGPVKACA